jgi:hypothetical protein
MEEKERLYQYEVTVSTSVTQIPLAVADATKNLVLWGYEIDIIEVSVLQDERGKDGDRQTSVSFLIQTTEEDMERFYDDMLYGFEELESVEEIPMSS